MWSMRFEWACLGHDEGQVAADTCKGASLLICKLHRDGLKIAQASLQTVNALAHE